MDIDKLNADFASAKTEIDAILDIASKENRELNAEELAKKDANFASMKRITALQAEYAEAEELRNKFEAGVVPPSKAESTKISGKAPKAEYNYANFASDASDWIIGNSLNADFATITTATGTGLLLPKTVDLPIQTSIGNAYRQGVLAAGGKILTTSNSASTAIPIVDMAAGEKLASEAGTTAGTRNEPNVAANNLQIGAFSFSSNPVWISNNQLAALPYNLLDSILPEMYDAKDQSFESDITTAVLASSTTNVVTLGSTVAVTFAKLQEARRKGLKRYDIQKFMIGHSDFFNAVEGLVDSNGKPVMVQDPQDETLVRVLGIPFVRGDFFQPMGATSKTVAAVISCRGFKLRDVEPARLARYVNQPAFRDQTGIELFQSHDKAFVDAAITLIKTPAS